MTISYSSISSAAQAGTTSVLFRYPATLASGDLVLWGVVNKYPTNGPASPTGFTQTTQQVLGDSGAPGVDVGDTYCTVFQKVSDGTEDALTETVNITSGNAATSRSVSYARTAGTGWLVASTFGEQGTASNSWSFTTGSIDLAANDVLVLFVAQNGDVDLTHSAHSLTASGITFGSFTQRQAATGTTQGDDLAMAIWEVPVTAGSGTVTMSFSMTLSGSAGTSAGGVVFVRLREDGAGPTPIGFSGTVPTFTGKQGTAFSQDLSSYFTGSETPFSYALQAGTLPPGLSLGSSTGIISGTPTTGGTYSGLVVRGTDQDANTADTNAFKIALESSPAVDIGYKATSISVNNSMFHTTASHSFHHDGNWWSFMRSGTDWNLYKEESALPASAGDTLAWTASAHLSAVFTSQQCTVCVDNANNKAYAIGFSPTASTIVFKVLTYSGGSWSVTTTFNLTGTGGVGLGTGSTFENHSKLSIGLDTNGVPMVFAGNKGAGTGATNGCHIAWPNNAGAIDGAWTSHTIDSSSITEADASGRFAGTFSQGGVNYVCVVYTEDTNNKYKLAYREVQTTLSNYGSGWTTVDTETGLSVDNHVWGGIIVYGGNTVVVTVGKNGDGTGQGRIMLITSQLGAGLTWTHKRHRVANGPGEAGALQETPSRPTCVMDQVNGLVWVFYHSTDSHPYGFVGYKTASLSALLAASGEQDVFDTNVARNATPIINDESFDAAWNVKTPAHSVTTAMGYIPITCEVAASASAADSIWYARIYLQTSVVPKAFRPFFLMH